MFSRPLISTEARRLDDLNIQTMAAIVKVLFCNIIALFGVVFYRIRG